MDGSVFYFLGGALVVAALVLSAIGIRRRDSFPNSKGEMAGLLVVFALIVAGTATYAVANAREEQDKRNADLAKEEAVAAQENAGPDQAQGGAGAAKPAKPAAQGSEQTLDVSSPASGDLLFDPDGFQVNAGTITIAYDNPSPVTHNIALEDDQGKVLAQSEDVTGGSVEITAPLTPGQYTYFCAIPGHRQAGMEGTLEVQ